VTPDNTPLPPLSRVESDALARRRRSRNWVLVLVLFGVAALFFGIAIMKLTPGHLSGG